MRNAEPNDTPVEPAAAELTFISTFGSLLTTITQLLAFKQLSCVDTVMTPLELTALNIEPCAPSVPCVKYNTG